MSKRRLAISGLITDVFGSGSIFLVNLILAPYIISHTGAFLYGCWLTTTSILTYLALADVGAGMAMVRLVASLKTVDPLLLNRLLTTGLCIAGAGGFFVSTAGAFLAIFIPGWLGVESADADAFTLAIVIASLAAGITMATTPFNCILVGSQQMSIDNVIRSIASLFGILILLYLLPIVAPVVALAIAGLATSIILGSCAAAAAKKQCNQLRLGRFSKVYFRQMLGFGGYFQLCRVANTVALHSDNMIIGATMGGSSVTAYSCTSKLATLFSVAISSKLPSATFPAIAEMVQRADFPGLQRAFLRLSQYAIRLAVIAALVYGYGNRTFVSLWVGEEHFAGTALTFVFCLWIVQDTIFRGTVTSIYATADLRWWSFWSIFEAVLNITLSLVLVRTHGLIGVALGTTIAKVCTTAWVLPVLVCRRFQIPSRTYVADGMLAPLLRSFPGILLALALFSLSTSISGWSGLLLVAIIAAFANILCFEIFDLVRSRLIRMINFSGGRYSK